MAEEIYTPQAPESFTGLLTNKKVVQNSILERSEKKLSLLEGRQEVRLFSTDDRSPPSLNNELDISSPNFIALGESYFILKFKYNVKTSGGSDHSFRNWICVTSPAYSFFKNIRVELNGTEVTQSSKVADMQIVQHILSLMESSFDRLQYADSDLYGLQKLDPKAAIKDINLMGHSLGVKRKHGYAFETDTADGPDFERDKTLKRNPTINLSETSTMPNTVLENCVRSASDKFQYKFRPFLPFFNENDAWLPPNTQIKIRFDLPQAQLNRYILMSQPQGAANAVNKVSIDLKQLDFVYPTYRMSSDIVDRVRLPKQLYFHTWCPRLVQKSITDNAGSLELLHNADIPRKMILFFTDLKLGEEVGIKADATSHSSNRLAMIHANLSQLRINVNDENLLDQPLKFEWDVSQGEDGQYYYDSNKSSYLRAYHLVQEFFGKTYGKQVPITATEFCNNYFMIPINLNLDSQTDNPKVRGNLSIDYQFTGITNAPIDVPGSASTSIKVNLLCLDKYLYTMSKEHGVKSVIV